MFEPSIFCSVFQTQENIQNIIKLRLIGGTITNTNGSHDCYSDVYWGSYFGKFLQSLAI